jgi:hypothetical protein
MSRPMFSGARSRLGAVLLFVSALLVLQVPAASAAPGYQLAPSPIALGAEVPVGVAVDQTSQKIYVAELSKGLFNLEPGQVEQFEPSGTPTASSPFVTGGQDFFTAVAVNPVTHGIYAYQAEGATPFGQKGTSKMSSFSSTGVLGSSFSPVNSITGTLAADSSGRVFMPNSGVGAVQVFSSTGTLESTISCAACPGGSFTEPGAAAFDSSGNLYVVDRGGGGRVVKLSPSAGSYSYTATLQSGAGAVAVAVDTSDDDVFVGDLASQQYHVVAYDSGGTAFDDFAAGLVSPSSMVPAATGQLAANPTTHKLYLTNSGGRQLWVLERVASIPAPTASASAPSPVGQTEATLKANVNPKGHVLTTCEFEYTDHADFLANGFTGADTAQCPGLLGSNESTSASASVSGLQPGTSYDYRIRIASFGGTAEAGPQALETLPPLPPEATTGSASALAKTTATLAGSVNPKGGKISNCHFEYVTEASFQSSGFTAATSKACLTTPSGNAPVSVQAKVSGLTAGTAYRFRVVATNNSGTAQAAESTFSTVAETCAENPALCPPPSGGGGSTPSLPAPTSPAPVTPPTAPAKKPLKCRKGFKKKKVRGKSKCVKIKKRHRPS